MKVDVDGTKFACQAGATKCTYSQVEAASPDITSVNLTGAKVTIIGTSFPDKTKFDAQVTYKGVSASSAYTSDTTLEVTFPKGLPFSKVAAAPVLIFKQKTLAAGVTIAY